MITATTNLRTYGRAITIIALGLLCARAATAQLHEAELHKLLNARSWSPEEMNLLEKGEVVVRAIETGKKGEIASLGVLKIRDLPPISMTEFRQSLSQKGSEAKKAGGPFSDPPVIEDLSALELEEAAIAQLRKCDIGSCDLNLSAEMIRRFQREIDWKSGNARTDATRIMKEMLVAYVRNYVAKGDSTLGTYNNRRKTVDLAASHRSLLSSSAAAISLAPEFVEYLREFPTVKLENVKTGMQWSIIDFGLKPTITISQSAAYTQKSGGEDGQLFLASKQIYSSRYLDCSLTFTMLLRTSTGNAVDTYVIFIDRSRSDALEGPLGRFARGTVQRKSMERIKTLLNQARRRLLVRPPETNTDPASKEDSPSRVVAAVRERSTAITIGGILVVLAGLLLWTGRAASRFAQRRRGAMQDKQ